MQLILCVLNEAVLYYPSKLIQPSFSIVFSHTCKPTCGRHLQQDAICKKEAIRKIERRQASTAGRIIVDGACCACDAFLIFQQMDEHDWLLFVIDLGGGMS